MALPSVALHQRGVDLWWTALYVLVMGTVTYARYAADKRRARAREWRVPEAQLHSLEILGGWPGGLLAQRRLRHKCSKGGYQFVFWLVVLLYQLVAADSLQNWRFSRAALKQIEAVLESATRDASQRG